MSTQHIISSIQARLRELRQKLTDLSSEQKQVKKEIQRHERGLKLFAERAGVEAGHEPPGTP